jgi:hypothetical protein
MDDLPRLPQKIVRDIMQRIRDLSAHNGLGVPGIDGLKDSPSTWRFINSHRADVVDAAGAIIEAKTAYLSKLKSLRLAYEDYLDSDADVQMIKDGKRMAHELMAQQHELQLLQLEAQIQQAKAGLSINGSSMGDTLEEKLRRLPTIREKMFLLASYENSELQAVTDAGYAKDGREWKQVVNKFEALKEKIIGGEL